MQIDDAGSIFMSRNWNNAAGTYPRQALIGNRLAEMQFACIFQETYEAINLTALMSRRSYRAQEVNSI